MRKLSPFFIKRLLLSATSVLSLSIYFSDAAGSAAKDPSSLSDADSISSAAAVVVLPTECNGQDFTGRDLRRSDLSNKRFKGAVFRNGRLEGCQFGSNDWYSVNVTGAKFTDKETLRQTNMVHGVSLFGVLGRVETLSVNGADLQLSTLPFNTLGRYLQESETKVGKDAAIAQFITAYLYETYGDEIQEALAHAYYSRAKTLLPEAFNNLGWMHENGRGTFKDLQVAQDCYTEARKHNVAKAAYNYDRFNAQYKHDLGSMFKVGDRYKRGDGVEQDEQEALYWFYKALHRKQALVQEAKDRKSAQQLAYEIAGMYNEGRMIPKDLERHADWLKQAAILEHPDAWLALGQKHELGQGVPQSYQKAFECYTLGLSTRPKQVHRALGFMYDKGCQDTDADGNVLWKLDRNQRKAFEHFMKAFDLGSESSFFNAARLTPYIPLSEEEKQKLKKWCLDSKNQSNGAIQFLLGTWHEKGHLVDRDMSLARGCYEKASASGNMNANMRLMFLNHQIPLDTVSAIPEYRRTMTVKALTASREVVSFVEQQVKTLSPVMFGGVQLHNLQEDFNDVVTVLKEEETAHQAQDVRLNYDFIWADPHLPDLQQSIKGLVPTTVADLGAIEREVLDAVRSPDTNKVLPVAEILRRFSNDVWAKIKTQSPHLMSRVRRAYEFLVSDKSENATLPLLTRKVRFAEWLIQNEGRCRDGLSDFLDEQVERPYLQVQGEFALAQQISWALINYRRDFTERHRNPFPEAYEEATEAMVLLRYRMQSCFGLIGDFGHPLYPGIGKGNDDLYRPDKVMKRFLRGGEIRHERPPTQLNVQRIKPYTPAECIKIVREKLGTNRQTLQDQFILRDPVLRQKYLDAYELLEENEYFNPTADLKEDPTGLYTDKFFEYLLMAYGYLLPKADV